MCSLRSVLPLSVVLAGCSPIIPVPSAFREAWPPFSVPAGAHRLETIERGEGPTVLLLHGGGTWSYTWRHQLAELDELHLVAPDLPGHGYSTGPLVRGPDAMDQAVHALATRAGGRVRVVGHSWGGGWALRLACAHPEVVEALVLIDSAGLDVPDRWDWELLKDPVLGPIAADSITRDQVREGLEAAFADASLVDEAMIDEVASPLAREDVRVAQQQLAQHTSWATVEGCLPGLTVPTLVLWGLEDRYLEPAIGERLAAAIPSARFIGLPDAGHNSHEEVPVQVNAALRDFLVGDPAGGP